MKINRLRSTASSGAIAAGALLVITACSGGTSGQSAAGVQSAAAAQTAAAATGAPVDGGELVFAQQFEPSCLDPTVLGDMHQATFALQYLDSLVAQDETGGVQPWLATSWEISPDGKEYTFKLREDVKFTDGEPLNAQAVKDNFDRILTKEGVAGGSSAQYLVFVDKTDVVDEHTVKVTLSRPFSPFLEEIAQSFVGIQSPKAISRSNDENCKSPVGTGPFIVQSYTPGQEAVLVKNPNYNSAPPTAKNQGPAHIDKIVWKFIPDGTARYGAITSGQADVADGLAPVNEVAAKNDPNLSVIFHDYPGNAYGLNFNDDIAPFDDEKVRQAFLYATDVDGGLNSIFFGLYNRPSILSSTTPFWAGEYASAYKHDLAKANQLLDEAGWTEKDADGYRVKDGKRLAVEWTYYTESVGGPPEYKAFAEQVQATTKEAGFEVTLNPISSGFPEYIEVLEANKTNIFIQKWTLNSPDVLRLLYASPDNPLFKNFVAKNPAFIDAIDKATVETDFEARKKLYGEAQKIYSDEAYGTGLFPESVRIVSRNGVVQGVRQEPALGLVNLQDAWVTK